MDTRNTAPYYDCDKSLQFIVQHTSLPEEVVETLIHNNNIYQDFSGTTSECADLYPDVDFAALREAHPDLLPKNYRDGRPYISFDAQTMFLVRVARVSPETAVSFLAAETAYMATQSIVSDDAEGCYLDWATRWLGTLAQAQL